MAGRSTLNPSGSGSHREWEERGGKVPSLHVRARARASRCCLPFLDLAERMLPGGGVGMAVVNSPLVLLDGNREHEFLFPFDIFSLLRPPGA